MTIPSRAIRTKKAAPLRATSSISISEIKEITVPATLEPAPLDLVPPPTVIARLARKADLLQILPAVAVDAMELAKKPDCSISQYAGIIERDVKLTVDILKIANSVVYCPPVPIASLHQAVVRLGLRECQNLIFTACVSSLMRRISLDQELIRVVLWQHSFKTALLAMSLNQSFRFGFEGEEFTAGLIHDLGRTLLAVVDCDQFTLVDSLDFDESPEQLLREGIMTGTDHCRLGAWYAGQQQLPPQIGEVILWHHQPEMAVESQRLTSLIAVADHMANHLQRFNETAGYEPSGNPFLPILAKFGDAQFLKQFHQTAASLMERAQHDASMM